VRGLDGRLAIGGLRADREAAPPVELLPDGESDQRVVVCDEKPERL
jgi:hypothetical protein